jgi:hypothetical protein
MAFCTRCGRQTEGGQRTASGAELCLYCGELAAGPEVHHGYPGQRASRHGGSADLYSRQDGPGNGYSSAGSGQNDSRGDGYATGGYTAGGCRVPLSDYPSLTDLPAVAVAWPTASYSSRLRTGRHALPPELAPRRYAPVAAQLRVRPGPPELDDGHPLPAAPPSLPSARRANARTPQPSSIYLAAPQVATAPELERPPEHQEAPDDLAGLQQQADPEDAADPEDTAEPEDTADPEDAAEPEDTARPEDDTDPEDSVSPEVNAGPEGTAKPEDHVSQEDLPAEDSLPGPDDQLDPDDELDPDLEADSDKLDPHDQLDLDELADLDDYPGLDALGRPDDELGPVDPAGAADHAGRGRHALPPADGAHRVLNLAHRGRWLTAGAAGLVLVVGATTAAVALGDHGSQPQRGDAADDSDHGAASPDQRAEDGTQASRLVRTAIPPTTDAREAPVLSVLDRYFAAINAHNFAAYRELFSPALRGRLSATAFRSQYGTTTDSDVTLRSIGAAGPRRLAVLVTFSSRTRPASSSASSLCTDWTTWLYLARHGHRYVLVSPPSDRKPSARSCG